MRGSRLGTWDKEPPRTHNPRHDVFFLFKGQFGVTPTLTPFVALTPKVLRRTKQLYKEKHFYTFFLPSTSTRLKGDHKALFIYKRRATIRNPVL
jgi:hypothetical protein